MLSKLTKIINNTKTIKVEMEWKHKQFYWYSPFGEKYNAR